MQRASLLTVQEDLCFSSTVVHSANNAVRGMKETGAW